MFKYRSALGVLLPVLVAVFLFGCGGGEYRKQETYYLVAANVNLAYWQTAKAGLLRAASELGVAADMKGPDTYDPKAEADEFMKLVNQEKPPAGILVSVADPELMTGPINEAIAKGIKVITVDSDAPKSKRLFFVGTDNYSIGMQSADYTVKQLGKAGTVIVYTIAGQSNVEERLRGYRDVFANYPAIRIIETVDIKGQAVIAFDTTKAFLAKDRTRMDAFVCLEAIACAEVAEVLSRNAIRDKVVIAMDATERTLDWIRKGLIQETVAQRPYTMTYVGLRMLADLNKYPPRSMETEGTLATVPEFVDTGASLVDKSNVDRYLKDLASSAEDRAAQESQQKQE